MLQTRQFAGPVAVAIFSLSSCLRQCNAQVNPINLSVPGFDRIFNTGGEKETTKKWWFWVIIGFLCAFFLVLTFFAIRGFRRYKRYQKERDIVSNVDELNGENHRVTVEMIEKKMEEGEAQDQTPPLANLPSTHYKAWQPKYDLDRAEMARRTTARHNHHHSRSRSRASGSIDFDSFDPSRALEQARSDPLSSGQSIGTPVDNPPNNTSAQ